jgi:hypothetical protein
MNRKSSTARPTETTTTPPKRASPAGVAMAPGYALRHPHPSQILILIDAGFSPCSPRDSAGRLIGHPEPVGVRRVLTEARAHGHSHILILRNLALRS